MEQREIIIGMKYYIKRVIYLAKKVVYNIFRWKIVIEDINEIPPEVIINSVLFAAYQEYSDKRKKVTITRAVKLIINSVERLNYQKISYGCYKYGEFSFEVHDIIRPIFVTRSLHGAKINKKLVRVDIVELINPIIAELKFLMTGTWGRFNKWAHEDRVPPELHALYNAHDRFETLLSNIQSVRRKCDYPLYQEQISTIISDLDSELDHVDDNYKSLYFEYTGLLEGFVVATKYHDYNFSHAKKLYEDLTDLYKDEISSLIFPFNKTIKGENKISEETAYFENCGRKLTKLQVKILKIKEEAERYNLRPTIEDLDNEITIEFNKLDENEKSELLSTLGA